MAPAMVVFVTITALAEGVVRFGRVPGWLVPPPSDVVRAMWEFRATLLEATGYTLEAAAMGFALSVIAGIGIAIALSASKLVERAFYPYAVFFQTVPIVAVAPLLVIWFGYGLQTVAISAFIVSVFPVIANTLTGLVSTDPALRDLFRLYGGGSWTTLWKLRLPSALPNIFTGMRVAAGLAVIGAIVAEFFASPTGLGNVIMRSMTGRNTALVFAGILLATALGLALFGLVNGAAHLSMRRWHTSEQERR
ncbi:MAG: ABC transporter permease [Phycisphaeraceae bacterium]